MQSINNRRNFLKNSCLFIAGTTFTGYSLFGNTMENPEMLLQEKEEEVSPVEDLMREHGVLKRVLLIYQEIINRIHNKKDFPVNTVIDSANIIRHFIENYHEKLEENYLFPRFKKANKLSDLVDTLLLQHQRGRAITDKVLNLTKKDIKGEMDKEELSNFLYLFNRMYSPHEAREDTVLFPAVKEIVSKKEYNSLGDEFEKKEQELFGKDGFKSMVGKVEAIERKLGIYDLAQFTPKI